MSKTGDSTEEARAQLASDRRSTLNMLRRFELTLTRDVMWTLTGIKQLDSFTVESREAEPFINVGFYARPPTGSNAEAIVGFLGGAAENPVILGTRDEDTRAVAAADIEEDETTMFNSLARAVARADGTFEIRTVAPGVPLESALRAETYRSAEDVMLTALGVFATAVGGAVPALSGPATTLNAAITAFKAAATTYLSQLLKHQ